MQDSLFRALADPTRRKILELLTEKDRTAGEIAEQFPIAFASVSHHLGVLKAANLVATEREGQFPVSAEYHRISGSRAVFHDPFRGSTQCVAAGLVSSSPRSPSRSPSGPIRNSRR